MENYPLITMMMPQTMEVLLESVKSLQGLDSLILNVGSLKLLFYTISQLLSIIFSTHALCLTMWTKKRDDFDFLIWGEIRGLRS